MKVFLCVLICAIIAVKAQFNPPVANDSFYSRYYEEFMEFKRLFNKVYDTPDVERMRFKIFAENKYKIDEHNKRFEIGEEAYKKMVNSFTDMLPHEQMLYDNSRFRPKSKSDFSNSMPNYDDSVPPIDQYNSKNYSPIQVRSFDFDYTFE